MPTGAIVAVKGLGGYHLVCDAADEHAVAALRARKHREDRPFALMVADLARRPRLVELDAPRAGAAASIGAADRAGAAPSPTRRSAGAVAPGAPELGVMLPYTPLHHLLLGATSRPVPRW